MVLWFVGVLVGFLKNNRGGGCGIYCGNMVMSLTFSPVCDIIVSISLDQLEFTHLNS